MIVFTPTSMGEVGDTAKNDYFESSKAAKKRLTGCFISWPSLVTGQLFPPTNHRIVQFGGQELLFRQCS